MGVFVGEIDDNRGMETEIQPTKCQKPRRRIRVAEGIRKDIHSYEVYLGIDGRFVRKTFPLTATRGEMQHWRDAQRKKARLEKLIAVSGSRDLPRSPNGWCYIYFISDGDTVKIGRAIEPRKRLAELQCAHPSPLRILAAVLNHASLEQAIHERFKGEKLTGEWFRLSDELATFIECARKGYNPVAMLCAGDNYAWTIPGWHVVSD